MHPRIFQVSACFVALALAAATLPKCGGINLGNTQVFAVAVLPGTNQIAVFQADPHTGALSQVAGSPFAIGTTSAGAVTFPKFTLKYLNHPGYATPSAGTPYFYVADSTTGQVFGFALNPKTGALSAVPGSPFSTASTTLTALTGDSNLNYVYAADSSGNIYTFQVSALTGSLTSVGSAVSAGGGSIGKISIDPFAGYLYSLNNVTGLNLTSFQIGSNGVPVQSGSTASLSPDVPNASMQYDATGNFLYLGVGHTGPTLLGGFSVAPGTGVLTALTMPTLAGISNSSTIDPTNQFQYIATFNTAANGGVVSFTRDPNAGTLTQTGSQIFGQHANGLAFDPTGRYLLVAETATGNLHGYQVSSSTGVLTELSGSPLATGVGATGANTLTTLFNSYAGSAFYSIGPGTATIFQGQLNASAGTISQLTGAITLPTSASDLFVVGTVSQ